MRPQPKTRPIPEGFHTLTPYITVRGAHHAIEFYKKAFGAKEVGERLLMPDGKVAHAQLQIGDSQFMLSDESEVVPTKSPQTLGNTTGCFNFYVEDVDSFFVRAVEAGATVVFPLSNQFYGDRAGR